MRFQTMEGTKLPDVLEYVKEWVESRDGEVEIWVGCDSLPQRWKRARFVEVIVMYTRGHGGHIVFRREQGIRVYGENKDQLIRDRLMREAFRLVEVATFLRDGGIETFKNVVKVECQLDYNKKKEYASQQILEQATGFVRAMGFLIEVKPNAPAASYAADAVCRGKEKGNGQQSATKKKRWK